MYITKENLENLEDLILCEGNHDDYMCFLELKDAAFGIIRAIMPKENKDAKKYTKGNYKKTYKVYDSEGKCVCNGTVKMISEGMHCSIDLVYKAIKGTTPKLLKVYDIKAENY